MGGYKTLNATLLLSFLRFRFVPQKCIPRFTWERDPVATARNTEDYRDAEMLVLWQLLLGTLVMVASPGCQKDDVRSAVSKTPFG